MERLVKMQCMLTCLVFLVTQEKIFLATFQRAERTLEYACFLRRENVRMLDA
jgi:hypothetical protein